MKWILLGGLAYLLLRNRQAAPGQAQVAASQPIVKVPTQAELNAQLMNAAQSAINQAENLISSI